ncbi:MAG: RNA methyltransferase [Bacteroidota bacterium]
MLTQAERKLYKSLSMKKHRAENGLFLVEGMRAVGEVLHSGFIPRVVLHTKEFQAGPEGGTLLGAFRKEGVRIEAVSVKELAPIVDTVQAQGIAAIVEMKRWTLDGLLPLHGPGMLLVALDAVSDPGNVGTMIRTADWFGVDGVILGKGCVDMYNAKVVRGSMGSIFHLPIVEDVDLQQAISSAREAGFQTYATGVAGINEVSGDAGRLMIVFGNEAHGISQGIRGLVDGTIAIPRFGRAESLNVSVACGAILWNVRRIGREESRA